jgi:hypothetical protein
MAGVVVPRFAVSAIAAAVAYTVGTLAAWYETVPLLGPGSLTHYGRAFAVMALVTVVLLAFAVHRLDRREV